MTDTDETKQRKCEEKIRLYTQLCISSTPSKSPPDTNYQKIYNHFNVLSKQNADFTDETSLTYSEFLSQTKGDATKATEALITWSLEKNNQHISDSMVDLILPTVFFETGDAQNPASGTKLMFWKSEIAGKYNTLVQKGNDLWYNADNLAKSPNITHALKRIGMKWNPGKNVQFKKDFLSSLGFTERPMQRAFVLELLIFIDADAIEKRYFDTTNGKVLKKYQDTILMIKKKFKEPDNLIKLLISTVILSEEEKDLIVSIYE
jgi:hypothetical protein